ncbi:PilZ domain-containing protein [Trujillonella endophytica]|uniref:PilZ domain-containing protein n=1 Tax=Trujillonella endophytica TaxID=673521 RepID=A0A1H8VEQ2_9ACTN|nr:PilZ domain-containing protein [Trujillella endophytica]SEP13358.1 PilZ domain-containing protein [Trujillella endophytica]
MTEPGVDHPVADSAADVTSVGRGLSVNARVEGAGEHAIVVRPSVGDYVGQDVVAVGETVEVFWHGPAGGRALPAVVTRVEYGAAPRWHLAVGGPAIDKQRRTAVRCRVSVPVTVSLRGLDLSGESRDLSEAGLQVLVDGHGSTPPEPGTRLGVTVHLEDGVARYRGEVVRARGRTGEWLMSLRFLDPAERDQDRLRRRVFQGLREERARSAVDRPSGG